MCDVLRIILDALGILGTIGLTASGIYNNHCLQLLCSRTVLPRADHAKATPKAKSRGGGNGGIKLVNKRPNNGGGKPSKKVSAECFTSRTSWAKCAEGMGFLNVQLGSLYPKLPLNLEHGP